MEHGPEYASGPPHGVVQVETVDLTLRGITLPSDRVGMVIAQPYISLTATEPYQCTAEARPQILQAIANTLTVARAAPHGAAKTHFTVFPEYSIPGACGIMLIETTLRAGNWPNGTVVIAGIDGLTRAEYSELLESDTTHVDTVRNGKDQVLKDEWVNCAITWVKSSDGNLERWVQPKLHPAWPEMNIAWQSMFRGRSIYLFKGLLANGAPYRFGTLVCFDWIATVESKKTPTWILEALDQEASPNQLPLSWLFIVQRNKKPSDKTFLTEVDAFFDQTKFPNALRDRACLVFANNAGNIRPGRTEGFGGCSLVLSHRSGFVKALCPPTFSNGGPRFRDGSDLLSPYRDVVFRERGACVHSFAQINSGSLVAGAAGRALPVENAQVYPIASDPDPRAPSAAVPACVKWLNDELDELPSLSSTYPAVSLAAAVDAAHSRTIAGLRAIPPQSVTHAVKLAAQESTAEHADQWDHMEVEAIEHLVNTLDIMGLGFTSRTVGADPAHAAVVMNGQTVDLLAIRGTSHEACIKHSKQFLPSPRRRALLISRDRDNNPWRRRFGSFLEPETPKLEMGQKFTDPSGGLLHLGYRRLLDIFQQSNAEDALQGAISAELAV